MFCGLEEDERTRFMKKKKEKRGKKDTKKKEKTSSRPKVGWLG